MMIDRQMLGHPIFSQTLMRQPLLGEDGLCCEAEAGDNAIHSIHGSCLIHGHGSQGLAPRILAKATWLVALHQPAFVL